jgi:mycofactocin precursor
MSITTDQLTARTVPDPTAPTVPGASAGAPAGAPAPADDALVVDALLVEDVSIDGMCGVY